MIDLSAAQSVAPQPRRLLPVGQRFRGLVKLSYCFIWINVRPHEPRGRWRPRGNSLTGQCDGRVQATSYWDTLFGLTEFCGCSPAYFVPAMPSGLNADPGAAIEWPGWFGVSS